MLTLFDFNLIRSFTLKRFYNIVQVYASLFFSRILKRHYLWGAPFILTIEPTNYCNLQCAQCETGTGKLKRPKGKMSFTMFKKSIDGLRKSLCYLILFNQGEPFLHNRLFDFISYAKSKKIYVITSTNGHFLSIGDAADKTISSKLDCLIISLDGADAAIYEKYRRGGDFNTVIDGIQKLVRLRQKLNKRYPKILLQFLIMKHNEHQIPIMMELAKKLNVDRLLFKTVQVSSYYDAERFLPVKQEWHRYESGNNKLVLKNKNISTCSRLWTSSVILHDGSIVPCCFDKNGGFIMGKIRDQESFKQIWRSSKYEKFRYRTVRKHSLAAGESIDLCTNCTQGQKVYL